jgi:hypothetical protein
MYGILIFTNGTATIPLKQNFLKSDGTLKVDSCEAKKRAKAPRPVPEITLR